MVGVQRYYEFWQWQAGVATCGAQIENALLEQQHGIPIVAITPSCPKPKHNQGGNGPVQKIKKSIY